jgi:hypothetical protein
VKQITCPRIYSILEYLLDLANLFEDAWIKKLHHDKQMRMFPAGMIIGFSVLILERLAAPV